MKTKILVCFTATLFAFLATSCSSLSKEQCMQGNWREIGFQDGVNGRAADRFAKHQDACSEYGVVPKKEMYLQGRADGLKDYCTPENGLSQGMNGNYYLHVCPNHLEEGFLRKYTMGKKIYSLNRDIDRTNDRIVELENKLDEEQNSFKRRNIRSDLSTLRRQKERMHRELTVLEIKANAT